MKVSTDSLHLQVDAVRVAGEGYGIWAEAQDVHPGMIFLNFLNFLYTYYRLQALRACL